jgi:hypothetical protein
MVSSTPQPTQLTHRYAHEFTSTLVIVHKGLAGNA